MVTVCDTNISVTLAAAFAAESIIIRMWDLSSTPLKLRFD